MVAQVADTRCSDSVKSLSLLASMAGRLLLASWQSKVIISRSRCLSFGSIPSVRAGRVAGRGAGVEPISQLPPGVSETNFSSPVFAAHCWWNGVLNFTQLSYMDFDSLLRSKVTFYSQIGKSPYAAKPSHSCILLSEGSSPGNHYAPGWL